MGHLPQYSEAMTELALPAGSLQAALVAFSEGADTVYFGMKQFSARQRAVNFSFEDLAKLRKVALEQGKKIYATVNTLADDTQLEGVVKTIRQLAFVGCDGIIVQDLGVVNLIKQQFPTLSLHSSTQMAVHTIEGVREMQRLGFERVVLARELTLQEIEAIRTACSDVELKVFIHGALCYAVSGLCMASEQLCGRSANCGSCAQICRSYFSVEPDSAVPGSLSPLGKGPKDGWFFSMSDLKAGDVVKQLEAMGIDSLKVEGRMKSPAYTGLAARYYRAILDGRSDAEAIDEPLSIIFARRQTKGWLADYGRSGQNFDIRRTPTLGSVSYPGHRGVKAATVLAVSNKKAVVQLERKLSLRDGLMFFRQTPKGIVEACKFAVRMMQDERYKSITEAPAGSTVLLQLDDGLPPVHKSDVLYLISRHDQNIGLLNEALPLFKKPVDLRIVISDNALSISGWNERATFDIPVSRARTKQKTVENLRSLFCESDTSFFTLRELEVRSDLGVEPEDLFLPLSSLKAVRRAWYEQLDRSMARLFTQTVELSEAVEPVEMEKLPPRSMLNTAQNLPFVDLKRLVALARRGESVHRELVAYETKYYLPLSPLMFDEQTFFNQLEEVIQALAKEGVLEQVRFGLNNIGQVEYFRQKGLACFLDIYFYLSNSEAARLVLQFGLTLTGGYLWMERHGGDFSAWPFTPTVIEPSFQAPLFISRSCFRHDSLLLSCENCPHRGSWYVTSDAKRYHVIVEDCITYLMNA